MEPAVPAPPHDVRPRPFLAPPEDAVPAGRCVRCGRPTAAGVGLCDADNPGRVGGPTATQMHATVLAGVLVGIFGLLLIFRFAISSGGPFTVTVEGAAADGAGAVHVGLLVRNAGTTDGIADCRVTRDGTPRPDDLTFRTERIAVGATVSVDRIVPAQPVDARAYEPDALTVLCH